MPKTTTPAESVKTGLDRAFEVYPAFAASWAEREEKIIAAFMRLPGVAETQFAQTAGKAVARNILLMVPHPPNDAATKFRRRFEPAGESATRREILAVQKAAARLVTALEALHAPAIAALNMDQHQFNALETRIRLLKLQAEQAKVPSLPKNAGLVKPKHTSVKQFSKAIAEHYFFATGKRPTRHVDYGQPGGPFFELLKEIFTICGVEANADFAARTAIEDMEIDWLKNDACTP